MIISIYSLNTKTLNQTTFKTVNDRERECESEDSVEIDVMKDTLLSIKCQNVVQISSVLNSTSWYFTSGHFRLLTFNIASSVAQYKRG